MSKYSKAQIKDSVNRVVKFIQTNKKVPNTVRVNQDTLKWADWKKLAEIKDAETRLKNYIKQHNTYPNYVTTCDVKVDKSISKVIWSDVKEPTSKNETLAYFEKTFGKVSTIDEALKKIENRGYAHYYNDKYSNKQSIDRMKAKTGINCSDACQVFWQIGKGLGYTVRCKHLRCSSGEGHVRLDFKHPVHTGGNWISRDPAAVLSTGNNGGIRYLWCSKGATVIATNPKWFLDTLNK